jgi:membrane protease YdiL (CAAX protease family)
MQIKELFKQEDGSALDKKAIAICVLTALCLTMNKYLPDMVSFVRFSRNARLSDLANWVLVLCMFYFIVPVVVIKLFFKEDLSDYGLKWKGAFNNYWIYIVMLCVMVPLVAFFSTRASFQARYPFYDVPAGEKLFPDFYIWEALYFLQFFALEFFFRGFMVHGLKKRFGIYSVLVMTIPYCMIHFGKPLPETIAAIIAGIVLGMLSLKSRSILLGVCIHYSVGLMMDLAALWHKT